ncbi:MAG: hypothetical protein C0404_14565 [Verrucomicrobia bacterium]|nr:hypothetical protein [Verrucomicrobiota bacterium]
MFSFKFSNLKWRGGSRRAARARGGVAAAALAVAFCLAAPACFASDEFKWSFDEKAEPEVKGADAAPANAAKPAADDGGKDRSSRQVQSPKLDEPDKVLDQEPALKVEPKPAVKEDPAPAQAKATQAANAAYEELLRENLDLRKKIEEASGEKETAKKENERLAREARDMEQRMVASAKLIGELKNEKGAAVEDPEKVKKLEQRLEAAEKEKSALAEEMKGLQKRMSDMSAATKAAELKPTGAVAPGSDLFKEQERENLLLKKKLVEIETERQKAVKASAEMEARQKGAEAEALRAAEKQKETEERLKEALSGEKQRQKSVQKLVDQLPALEKELTRLKTDAEQKEAELVAKQKDLETLKSELKLREQRLVKAEKMSRIMEKAREEILQASDSEKRDMHYNMGVVYAKEGRHEDAEKEYLQALRIDPTDAASHYNLGVLYDDVFRDKKRAAMHYRRYMKLSPHASDIDAVKSWLMRIEINQ